MKLVLLILMLAILACVAGCSGGASFEPVPVKEVPVQPIEANGDSLV